MGFKQRSGNACVRERIFSKLIAQKEGCCNGQHRYAAPEVKVSLDEFIHQWDHQGRVITFTWVGETNVAPSRVYALAFVSSGQMLLVSGSPDDPGRWLPGGGIEAGETAEKALVRELLEEADATIVAMEKLGSERMDDPGIGHEYHTFYWCRVVLEDQVFPRPESTLRHLISPDNFLDTLSWGRSDPKAVVLLERALEVEREQVRS